ncbi:Acyl-CoA synthetase short-chain member 3, mitochondrial, partial [Cladochytrium tenue]
SPITSLALSSAFAPLPPVPGSAGLPTAGMDVRVVDDLGREVKRGEMGNLVLGFPLHPTALPTLWRNRAGFTKTYLGKFGSGDMGGWFDTGDAAMMDERGYVTILARSDDIIQVAAHRLGTGLIEQVVTGHPRVIECCVVGAPDSMKGQVPFALVVAREGPGGSGSEVPASSANDQAARDLMRDINEHVRKDLGPIAQLGGLVVTSKLPKTRSGKTLRRSVRAIVENAAENKPDGEVPVPPTVEDAGVIPVVKEAIFAHFAALAAAEARAKTPKAK